MTLQNFPNPSSDSPTQSASGIAPKPTWGAVSLGSFSSPDQIAFIYRVYAWMCTGLLLSAAIAVYVSITPTLSQFIFGNQIVFYTLLIFEIILVFTLAMVVHKISSVWSALIFLFYAALNGLTLSVIFLVYTTHSIAQVFIITAGVFGALSLYGFFTKRDLTTFGSLASMCLLGWIVAAIVNLFARSDLFGFILACLGVLIFTVLTAYDTQKLKWLYQLGRTEGSDGEKKESINGALTLYLDFINLFLDLLRIFGKRR